MKNDKFWNECSNETIRGKVAEFMENSPLLSKFQNEKWYDLEDAIVSFIEANRYLIASEVESESFRQDLIEGAYYEFGEGADIITSVLPFELVDNLMITWRERLWETEGYYHSIPETLSDILCGCEINSPYVGIDSYTKENIKVYAAYLKDWYSKHDAYTDPIDITTFWNSPEISAKEIAYYTKLSQEIFSKEDANV